MPEEVMTYAELGDRLGINQEAARAYVRRKRLRRVIGNDGRTRITVDIADLNRSPAGTPAVPKTAALLAQIEALKDELTRMQVELAKAEIIGAGHRADFEHERDRADQLVTDLRAIAERMAITQRPWWKRLVG